MGLNDPIIIAASRRGFELHRGREAVYDEDDVLRTWPTMEDARQWAITNLGVDPLEGKPPHDPALYEQLNQTKQGRLF